MLLEVCRETNSRVFIAQELSTFQLFSVKYEFSVLHAKKEMKRDGVDTGIFGDFKADQQHFVGHSQSDDCFSDNSLTIKTLKLK